MTELDVDVLDSVEGIEFIRFGGEDVVRHKLVQRIVEAYAEHADGPDERRAPGGAPRQGPAAVRSA